ncbi:MAG: hypothetical protein IH975_11225, partial [Nitrospinae bacterium]|nr:hypothetical protein [Nitrospinota bacterium]
AALDLKLKSIYRAQAKLRLRRIHEPNERDIIKADLAGLDLKKGPIVDRIDVLEATGLGFTAPEPEQVKEIRNAVKELSMMNVRATTAVEIFEAAVDILEMTVGNDALAT